MKRVLLPGIVIASALAFSAAQSRLPGPDPDNGAIALPPGPAQVLPANHAKYAVQMPPFAAAFSDIDIAQTLTFVRREAAPQRPSCSWKYRRRSRREL